MATNRYVQEYLRIIEDIKLGDQFYQTNKYLEEIKKGTPLGGYVDPKAGNGSVELSKVGIPKHYTNMILIL